MNATDTTGYPPTVMAGLEKAIRSLSMPRDPRTMREASARMDRMREELRQKHGDIEIAVDLIRDARDIGRN